GGRVRRQRLQARTKTDAMAEQRALQTDYERGDVRRVVQASPTLAELADDYLTFLERRLHDPDPRLRRSPRTVADVRYKLDRDVLPRVGSMRATGLTRSDVLRLLDWLNTYETTRGTHLSPNTRTGVLSALSGLIRFGVKRGLVERNVVHEIDRDDRPG